MINKNKFILFLLFLLVIAIPVSFASENVTGDASDDIIAIESVDNISTSDDDEILGASDVYFDASASSDGDGSQSKPYKTLSSTRLGTNNHFNIIVQEFSGFFKLEMNCTFRGILNIFSVFEIFY